jgi:hypothetical protein
MKISISISISISRRKKIQATIMHNNFTKLVIVFAAKSLVVCNDIVRFKSRLNAVWYKAFSRVLNGKKIIKL